MPTPKQTTSSVIPTIRYRDANAALEWLCKTFGFEKRMVVDDGLGTITHAQLTFGNGMIMIGDDRDDAFGSLQKSLLSIDSMVTQSAYLVVEDIESFYEEIEASDAQIEIGLHDTDYGGKFFACRDPEGQLWNFGEYDPWATPPQS